jgi:hypothetical protein
VKIRAICPGCGISKRIPAGAAGRYVRCPNCGRKFQTPEAQAETDKTDSLSSFELLHADEFDCELKPLSDEQKVDRALLEPVDKPARTDTPSVATAWTHALDRDRARAHRSTAEGPLSREQEPEPDESDEVYEVNRARGPGAPLEMLDQVGRFKITGLLGEGGFGRVYRAYDPQLDREVALKMPRFTKNKAAEQERFLREAKAAARLRHPGIVMVYDSGEAEAGIFIASEYVEGCSLEVLIKDDLPPFRQAARWIRDLARAVHYAHTQGLIHRDIKPGNIIINRKGKPRLTDFGLAKRVGSESASDSSASLVSVDATVTTEGTIVGTPAYMAPEQARGDSRAVGRASDQYSLGAVFYEVITGRPPFLGKTVFELLSQLVDRKIEPPRPQTLNSTVPAELEAICLRALAYEPGQRYASCGELAEDLERFLAGEPVTAIPQEPKAGWVQWNRRWLGLALSLGVVATCQLVLLFISVDRGVVAAGELVLLAGFGLTVYGLRLIQLKRRIERQENELRQWKEELRQKELRTDCRFDRLKGLEKCAREQIEQGVLLLARALIKAIESGDQRLERKVGADLLQWMRKVDEPPDLKLPRADWWATVERLIRPREGQLHGQASSGQRDETTIRRSTGEDLSEAERKDGIQLSAVVITRMEINERGEFQTLDHAWKQRRDQLFDLIGLSQINSAS